MKIKTTEIEILRDPLRVPKPGSNPVAGLILDTLEYYGLSQAAAARAMKVSPGAICDLLKGRKSVSSDLALRLERCLGIPADFLLKLQTSYQYCVAYHAKRECIEREVRRLVPG